jgi:hypothetical protein
LTAAAPSSAASAAARAGRCSASPPGSWPESKSAGTIAQSTAERVVIVAAGAARRVRVAGPPHGRRAWRQAGIAVAVARHSRSSPGAFPVTAAISFANGF